MLLVCSVTATVQTNRIACLRCFLFLLRSTRSCVRVAGGLPGSNVRAVSVYLKPEFSFLAVSWMLSFHSIILTSISDDEPRVDTHCSCIASVANNKRGSPEMTWN